MGRGGEKVLIDLEDVLRSAPDIIEEEEQERDRRFLASLEEARRFSENPWVAMEKIITSPIYRERLSREDALPEVAPFLERFIEHILEDHPGSIKDGTALLYAMQCFGVASNFTPLIVQLENTPKGQPARHLRDNARSGVTLCKKAFNWEAHQQLRGVFTTFPSACGDCAQIALTRPEDDPVRIAATEGRDYQCFPDQDQELKEVMIDCTETLKEMLRVTKAPVPDIAQRVTTRAFTSLCETGASRFYQMTPEERVQSLFDTTGRRDEVEDVIRGMKEHVYENYDSPATEGKPWMSEEKLVFTMRHNLPNGRESATRQRAEMAAHMMAYRWPLAARSYYEEHWDDPSRKTDREITDLFGNLYGKLIRGEVDEING